MLATHFGPTLDALVGRPDRRSTFDGRWPLASLRCRHRATLAHMCCCLQKFALLESHGRRQTTATTTTTSGDSFGSCETQRLARSMASSLAAAAKLARHLLMFLCERPADLSCDLRRSPAEFANSQALKCWPKMFGRASCSSCDSRCSAALALAIVSSRISCSISEDCDSDPSAVANLKLATAALPAGNQAARKQRPSERASDFKTFAPNRCTCFARTSLHELIGCSSGVHASHRKWPRPRPGTASAFFVTRTSARARTRP